MDMIKIHVAARRLVEIHGDKAELEASQKFKACEQSGDEQEIEDWRRIRAAVREMKPAHES